MSRYGSSRNPFDDEDDGGFGASSSRAGQGYRSGGGMAGSRSRDRGYEDKYGGGGGGSGSRYDYGGGSSSRGSVGLGGQSGSSYQQGKGHYHDDYGYGHGEPPPMSDAEFQQRKQEAIRKMEDSSFSSLRTLHDCVRMGTETTEELERQAEALDRTEARLDEIHVGVDKGERNLRKIKSPFGGVMNYFSKKKTVSEVTDPKGYKPSTSDNKKSSSGSSKSGAQKGQGPVQQQSYKSTGSEVVDKNLDLMGRALDDLMGIGELIGEQLEDSEQQIDRITYKTERDDIKLKKLNQGIKKELHK